MPEEFDVSNLDLQDPEAIKRLREAYERQRARADKADEVAAAAQAERRSAQVKTIFDGLNAPGKLSDLYPADAEVTEDAVKAFLQDKVGLSPETTEAWQRYEKMTDRTEPPPPELDPDEAWAKKELAATEKFYRRQNKPTDKEVEELEDLKLKVFGKLDQWDREVEQGRRERIISPEGFGGRLDPPAYARRATLFTQ